MATHATGERRRVSGARPLFHEDDVPELLGRVEKIIRGGRLIFGENTREFEESFREYVGTRHAVTVNSCTTALEIAMRFYGAKGREVIVPTNTFASCVKAVMYAGGTPVLASMNPETFCLDTEDVLSRINERTAGVLVVHIAGLVYPDMDRLREVCRERGLFRSEAKSMGAFAQPATTPMRCIAFTVLSATRSSSSLRRARRLTVKVAVIWQR